MANNVVSDQMKSAQVNSFTGGINTDLHPMLQPSDTLTDCVNGTLITYNGNENMLQNDMGNYALEGAKLPVNYVPIGVKEYGGILYVVAYNPIDKKTQVGSYPSPKVTFGDAKTGEHSITVSPYNIKQIDKNTEFDPLLEIEGEVLSTSRSEGESYYLHSNIVKSTSNLLEILGDLKDDSFQLTINDQYKLILEKDLNHVEPWMQTLKYFCITLDGKIEDITEKIVTNSAEFSNVAWESAGWVGIKYELADVLKNKQSINNVVYPTYGRSTNTLWTTEEKDGVLIATGDLSKDYNYYESPYVMIPEGDKMLKCYWEDKIPENNDTVVYYSNKEWEVKDPWLVSTSSDNGNWHTIRFTEQVTDISRYFKKFDLTPQEEVIYLYVFLPTSAYINESSGGLFGDSINLYVFIHNKSREEFNFTTKLKFINKPENATLRTDSYIRELYCPVYNEYLDVNEKNVDYIIVNEVEEGLKPLTSFKNIITHSPITNQDAMQEEPDERTLSYTSTEKLGTFIDNYGDIIESDTWNGPDTWESGEDVYSGTITFVKGVSAIPEKAFYQCAVLRTVVIPKCITSIGSEAFRDCSNLEYVEIPESVISLGNYIFTDCAKLPATMGPYLLKWEGTEASVEIPSNIKFIGDGAFKNNLSVKKVTMGNNVVHLGNNAFDGCKSLANITLSQGIQEIPYWAFGGCENLKNIVLPVHLTAIGQGAFNGADLIHIIIPKSVTTINKAAFFNCPLTTVVIAGNPTIYGDAFFQNTSTIQQIYYLGTRPDNYMGDMFGDKSKWSGNCPKIYCPQGLLKTFTQKWGYYTNYLNEKDYSKTWICQTIDDVFVVEDSKWTTKTVSADLFTSEGGEYTKDQILEILLPDSVTSIGNDAFEGMVNLRQISLPVDLTLISSKAFTDCPITGLVCGEKIKTIDPAAFQSTSNRCVYISDLSSWCNIYFTNENSNPLNGAGSRLYVSGKLVKDLSIPEDVAAIKNYSFCNGVFNKVVAYHNITRIGTGAFTSGCDIELYGINENIVIKQGAMDQSTVYVSPEIIAKFAANDSWPISGIWTTKLSYVYITGKDTNVWLGENGTLKSIVDQEYLKYVIPQSWKIREGYTNTLTFDSNVYQKPKELLKKDFLDEIPTKYVYNIISSTERLDARIMGWHIDEDNKFKLFTKKDGESLSNIVLPIESNAGGIWNVLRHKPYATPDLIDASTNVIWKDQAENMLSIGTGNTLEFTVNAEMRIQNKTWDWYKDRYDLRWRVKLYGETANGDRYKVFFEDDPEGNYEKKSYNKDYFELTNIQSSEARFRRSRNFTEVTADFKFDSAIPEGIKKIYAESVFYCVEKVESGPSRILVLDQTLQSDYITIPEYVKLDYSNANVIGFTYDVGMQENNKAHTVTCSINYNTVVDSFSAVAILSNVNGSEVVYSDSTSGVAMEHEFVFNCPEEMQFAQLDIYIDGVSKFKKTILINSEINNERWKRMDMSTLDWGKVIDAIIKDPENEWKLNVNIEVDTSNVYSEPCSYKLIDNQITNLSVYTADTIPANIIPFVDKNNEVPKWKNYNFADLVYAPMKVDITLGKGIKINGTLEGCSAKFISNVNGTPEVKEAYFDTSYVLGQSVKKLMPIGLSNILLKKEGAALNGIPTKDRLLKYLYKPLNFDKIWDSLGLPNDDRSLFKNYWSKNKMAVGNQDGDLTYELWDLDTNTGTAEKKSLAGYKDQLPLVFPVKINQRDSDHGVIMPISLAGAWNDTSGEKLGRIKVGVKERDRCWVYEYTSWPSETDISDATVSVVNKKNNIFAIVANTSDTEAPYKFAWFGAHALLDEDAFYNVEKELLLAGLAIKYDSTIPVESSSNIYRAFPEIQSFSLNTITSVVSNCTCTCGNTYTIGEISWENSFSETAVFPQCSYIQHMQSAYILNSSQTCNNPFLQTLNDAIVNDGMGPGFHSSIATNASIFNLWYDSSDGTPWKELVTPVIRFGRGHFTMTCYNLNLHGTGSYESVTNPYPFGSFSDLSTKGEIYPWPLGCDNNLFCQTVDKFVTNNSITINNQTKSLDEWIKIYLTELVKELRYVDKYKNANETL